jgi:predicted aldo/keto reductase-like oxidoreductase
MAARVGAMVSITAGKAFASIARSGGMQYRTLGRTGAKVSLIGVGGYHIGQPKDPRDGIAIIRGAIDNGVTFMDNSWDYHLGDSEIRMGKALRDGYRDKVFLMTKVDGRTRWTVDWQLDESLKRLQTDHVDLLQIHEVIRDNDPDRVFGKDGAIEALIAAKKSGKIRFFGFSGHKTPAMLLKMIRLADQYGVTFDTVQMPLNVMDAHYDSFEKKVLPVLVKDEIGVLGMKPMGDHIILDSKTVTPVECLHYSMNLPTSVVITGCDSMQILEQALSAARNFHPMTSDEVASLLAKTAQAAQAGKYELYKTSHTFDGTYQNPQWLG